MKDTNKFVNNKDFGVIARSSRGSNTPTQVGNDNQREAYNSNRDVKYNGAPRTGGNGAKSTAKDAAASYGPKVPTPLRGVAAESRTAMRKGGKGK
jgi:hypothetical protein